MAKLEQGFEIVHAVHDYWDGPRSGVAEYRGRPHWFENIFDERQDDYSDLFWLKPLSDEILRQEQQRSAIFLRWQQAFHRREVDVSTHPALPQDKETYDRLANAIQQEIAANSSLRFKVKGQLKPLGPPAAPGTISDLQVKWDPE
ncbi:MAG TPA: hypothetical protein VKZ53_19240 [Candidatus Angelobacter sp.]|nr:hypothetical protein [Candidatus Angelobacter sp.]